MGGACRGRRGLGARRLGPGPPAVLWVRVFSPEVFCAAARVLSLLPLPFLFSFLLPATDAVAFK